MPLQIGRRQDIREARATPIFWMSVAAVLMLGLLASSPVAAQSFSATISPATGDIGTVTSAISGNTTWTISAANSSVTRISGTGLPTNASSTRATVTVSCTGTGNSCGDNKGSTAVATITIATVAMPTGRALALSNFNVAAGTGTPSATQGSGSTFTFTITDNFRAGATKTFHLGADFSIASTGSTGAAAAQYVVTTSGAGGGSSVNGAFSATVRRALSIAPLSSLAFGNILRPTTGTNTITISQVDGARSISGGGNGSLMSGTSSRATFTMNGEGGQAFSVTTPSTLTMTAPGGATITANLVPTASSGTLSGSSGNEGTAAIGVGGNFNVASSTITGAYSGTFQVTVQYN